jgi:hypothetical protein
MRGGGRRGAGAMAARVQGGAEGGVVKDFSTGIRVCLNILAKKDDMEQGALVRRRVMKIFLK